MGENALVLVREQAVRIFSYVKVNNARDHPYPRMPMFAGRLTCEAKSTA